MHCRQLRSIFFRAAGKLLVPAVFLVTTFSAASRVRGQEIAPTYTIRGTVTDVQGVALDLSKRAEIRVFSIEGIRTQHGGADGKFAIGNLPAGDYEIEIRVSPYVPEIISDLHVKSDMEPWPIRMKMDLNYDCMHPDHVHYESAEVKSAAVLSGTIAGDGALDATTVVVETFQERKVVAIFNPDSKGAFQIPLPAGKYVVLAVRKGDPQQSANPVWITRTTVAKVWLGFPSANGGIVVCQ